MRIAALIIGIFGGLFALIGVVIALTSAGVSDLYNVTGSGQAMLLGVIGLACALLGIVGAVLALSRPLLAGLLMVVAAVGGTIALTGAFLVGGVILLIGGIFALTAAWRNRRGLHPSVIRV